jgi:hypothetical protein
LIGSKFFFVLLLTINALVVMFGIGMLAVEQSINILNNMVSLAVSFYG